MLNRTEHLFPLLAVSPLPEIIRCQLDSLGLGEIEKGFMPPLWNDSARTTGAPFGLPPFPNGRSRATKICSQFLVPIAETLYDR